MSPRRYELSDFEWSIIQPLLAPAWHQADRFDVLHCPMILDFADRTVTPTSRSREAWETATPRSLISFTVSTLNSRLNTRRCILDLRSGGKP